jgi:ABC-type nitrate/sulfonate/bicarbonate transport system substrate-binding protein
MSLDKYDKVPVFMAATPDFVEKNPHTIVAYLKAWLDVKKDFKENPKKVSDVIYSFFTSKGYNMDPKTFATAMGRVDVDPGFPTDLVPYLTKHTEALIQEKKVSAMPDWKKALRTDFMEKARAGS